MFRGFGQRSGPGQFNQRITVPEIEDENDFNCYDNTAYDDISWSDDECPDADYAITSSDSEDDVPETKDVHHVNGNVPHARITKVQIEKRKSWEPNEDMKPTRKTSKSKNNQWNVFAETSSELGTHSERRRWRTINVVVKIVLCTIFFFIVLGTATLSKLTFLYMTFYINPGEGFSFKHQDVNNENKTFHYELKKPVPNHTMDIKWIWAIIMILCSQYLFTVIFSLWTIIFKKTVPIKCLALIMTLVTETLHTVGLSIFIFYVLPSFDPLTACLLTWNVAAIPGILKIFLPDIPSTASLTPDTKMSTESKTTTKSCCRKIIDVIMAVLHLGSMAAWVYQSYYDRDIYVMVLLPVSLTLISLSWWENFIALPKKKRGPDYDPKESGNGCFSSIKDSLGKRNVKTIFIATVWKILLTIGFPALFFSYSKIECVETFFFLRKLGTNCSVFGNIKLMDDRPPIYGTDCHNMMPFLVACVNIVSSVICYKTGKSACKILAQVPCFTLPIMLSGPLSVAILLSTYTFPEEIPIFMGCTAPWVDIGASSIGDFLFHFTVEWWIPIGLVGYVSMLYIVGHTFSPKSDRLARTDRLFIKPLFCGVLLEQSMLLNRRRDEDDGRKHKLKGKWTLGDPDTKETDEPKGEKKDEVPMIYICATMWHETEQEMINMLKSVFRLDSDQSARKLAQSFFGLTDPDYYEFEAHIFFDDAFQAHDDTCVDFRVNDFVKQLVRVMQKAASDIHGGAMEIQSPVKVATPYGGRLTWNMPGGNKIIAHVKDKAKIRHRKRWSQVMYMYYFLGYQLLSKKMSMKRKKMRAENTYLLALDGDVDFQPMAVQILVDRMKTNPNLGAACGRIHPIGSGPMVWYQKFEYAVSHWLAKATEHMLGCVLCSPGCFSLFRGSALMDDNVMKKYTTPPTEARHYVQYDQGEDRWLCTLLLQQGYRVEYAAASDSYTFAPEGFYEFYNQRRRWTPSTMANILDLLMTWTATTKKNEDISWLYMFYQTSLLTFSIITPGTIFLLVLGALRTAYADIPLYGALILNLIPVCIFVFLCLKAPSKYQLAFAGILSIFYSLLMMLVLVGLIKQVGDYGFCSVTTIFMTTVASIFVVAAFLHPQEFTCILHGFLYFLTIPSMSMLLVIYSLANLHNVSWGTREVKQAAPPPKQQDNTAPPVKHNMLHQFVGKVVDSHNLESDFGFRCGNMFTCACCPSENSSRSTMDKVILARLDELDEKITVLASVDGSIRDVSDLPTDSSQPPPFSKDPNPFEGAGERENPVFEEEIMKVKENSHSPFWIKDDDLGDGDITMSTTDEDSFWEELISLYLFPLVENKDHKKKIQTELIELRNKVCLAFLLINALFIILIYALETISESSENLSFKIPCDIPNFEGERVEPISMTFTLVFGVMLSLQFTAMLFHRFSTFLHIASITNLQIKTGMSKKSDQPSPVTVEETIDLVREMQTVARDEDTMSVVTVSGNSTDSNPVGKELWHKLAVRRKPSIAPKTLSRAFMKNYGKLVNHLQNDEINDVTEQDRTQQLQKKFKRFERKSLATIVKMAQASPDVKQQIISRGKKRWDMLREKVKGKQGMSDVVSRVLQQKKLEDEQANKDSFMHIPDTQNDAGVHPLILLARKHKEMEQQKAKQEAGIAEESEPDDQTETSIHIEAAVSTPVSVRSRRQQNGEEAGIAEESEPDDQTETSVIHIEAAVSTPVSVRSRRQQNGELPPPSLRLPRDNVV